MLLFQEGEVRIRYHPVFLDPTIPSEGLDLDAYLQKGFGYTKEEAHADAVTQAATDTLASAVQQARLKLISREDLQRAIADARSAAVSADSISAAEALLSKLPAVVSFSQDWLVKSAAIARAEEIGGGSFGTVYKVRLGDELLAEKHFPVKTEAAEEREVLERRLRREFRALHHAQHRSLCTLHPSPN